MGQGARAMNVFFCIALMPKANALDRPDFLPRRIEARQIPLPPALMNEFSLPRPSSWRPGRSPTQITAR